MAVPWSVSALVHAVDFGTTCGGIRALLQPRAVLRRHADHLPAGRMLKTTGWKKVVGNSLSTPEDPTSAAVQPNMIA
jgi:hypothetical protein